MQRYAHHHVLHHLALIAKDRYILPLSVDRDPPESPSRSFLPTPLQDPRQYAVQPRQTQHVS